MPARSNRPCKQQGCPNLTRDASGYCEEHIHLDSEQHTEYKRYRTDKREQAFTYKELKPISAFPFCHTSHCHIAFSGDVFCDNVWPFLANFPLSYGIIQSIRKIIQLCAGTGII